MDKRVLFIRDDQRKINGLYTSFLSISRHRLNTPHFIDGQPSFYDVLQIKKNLAFVIVNCALAYHSIRRSVLNHFILWDISMELRGFIIRENGGIISKFFEMSKLKFVVGERIIGSYSSLIFFLKISESINNVRMIFDNIDKRR